MSDYRRDSVDPTAPLTHADAEALISARLDGPLDPAMNRALQAHLATCDSCRAFAAEMEMMATAFRDFPSLPPSSAVSRRVRAEIRSGGSPMRKISRWITTSRSAPLTALGGAAVALALVIASVFGNLGGDDGNNNKPSLGAPESAQNLTATSENGDNAPTTAASNSARQPAPTATSRPNVTAPEPTAPSNDGDGSEPQSTQQPNVADSNVTQTPDEPTQEAQASGNNGENPAPTQSASDGGDGNPAAASGPSDGDGAPTAEPTREGGNTAMFSPAGEGTPAPEETATPEPTATPTEESTPEPQPTETPTEEPTNTPEPEPTETPTEEPTNTPEPEPTQTPTEEPTNTPEPEPTETPTQEPTSTPTEETAAITAANDATPEPSPTATPTPESATPTPSPTEGASIVPRGNGQTDDQTESAETPTPEPDAATEEAGQGGDGEESPPIQSTGNDNGSETGAAEDVTPASDGVGGEASNSTPEDASKKNTGTEESAPAGPLSFGDLASADYSVSVYGTYLPGPNGNHAAEQAGGGLQIVDSNGGVITSGYGYNPVWGGDGSLYTAGGAISEGSSAINQWSGGDGPGFITQGDYLDVPAGDGSGGFYFVRQLPGTSTLELHIINVDDPVWSAEGYTLVSQSIYIYNDVVYIPTDQGWLAVPVGGGESVLGPAIPFTYDLVLDHGSGQIAFVDDSGNVYVAPATDPSAAGQVGSISGNGGIAWTSYGLAIASGDTVAINGVPVITGGGDLGAPVWTGSELLVADAAAGGEVRIITDAEIQKALGY